MEFLEKWFTKKNAVLFNVIIGVCTIGIVLLSPTVDISSTDLGFTAQLFCILYYLYFFASILLCAMYCFLYFKKANKDRLTLIGMLMAITAVIVCFFNWKIISALQALINENIYGLAELMSVASSIELRLNLLRLVLIANAVFGGYLLYLLIVKKSIDFSFNVQQNTSEHLENANEQLSKGADIALDQLQKGRKKLTDFFKTKNGKITGIAIILCAASFVVIFTVNANKKTSIDLAKTCDYTLTGESGNGSITKIKCSHDYDGDDIKINRFLRNVNYSIEDNGTLSNGDKVIIYADYSDESIKELKLNITNDIFETEVSGLIVYYEKAEDVPNDVIEKSIAVTKDRVIEELKEPRLPYGHVLYPAKDIKAETPSIVAMLVETGSTYSHKAKVLYKTKASGTVDDKTETSTIYIVATISDLSSSILQEDHEAYISTDYVHRSFGDEITTDEDAINYLKEYSYITTLEQVKLPN